MIALKWNFRCENIVKWQGIKIFQFSKIQIDEICELNTYKRKRISPQNDYNQSKIRLKTDANILILPWISAYERMYAYMVCGIYVDLDGKWHAFNQKFDDTNATGLRWMRCCFVPFPYNEMSRCTMKFIFSINCIVFSNSI